MVALFGVAMLGLVGCGNNSNEPEIKGQDALFAQVEKGPVGSASDQWIEFTNLAGEWEKTGLIFGYVDDRGECEKAIAGLKRANPAREYRCSAAN